MSASAFFNPVVRIAQDLRAERAVALPLPPGPGGLSAARTLRFSRDPLPLLLEAYEQHGPVFTMRLLHSPTVFLLGPEANHHVTVANAGNFLWRDGRMGELIPLLGDGLLTTDGAEHRTARRLMLPAFHRERVAAGLATILEEAEHALDRLRPGDQVDLYDWMRHLALRVAARALFGFDPDRAAEGLDPAREFERALSYYGRAYPLRMLRGPGSPWSRMHAARRRLDRIIFGEVVRRRRTGARRDDVMSLLLDARSEDGAVLSDVQVRDQMMTLLFAGHDTSTSTVSFLVYELARHPDVAARLRREVDGVLDGAPPTAAQLMGGGLPELDMALDETLRLYPAAWIGPRVAREPFRLASHTVPGGVHVAYCSWASHRLPEVFPHPDSFVPERFSAEARTRLPKGAYVPFGGGSRTCIGMRFGQLEVKAVAALLLQRFAFRLPAGYELSVRQMPTLSPAGGLPVELSAA